MRCLTEEELIDVLFDVPHDAKLDQHLASCDICSGRLEVLRTGAEGVKMVEPQIPENMPHPFISSKIYKRRLTTSRITWFAAAAMFLLSILGFRMEVQDGNFAMQFAMFSTTQEDQSERIAQLEEKLVSLIEMNAQMTQNQMDARFNAFYDERDNDINTFSKVLETKMEDFKLSNQTYLANVKDDLKGDLNMQNRR